VLQVLQKIFTTYKDRDIILLGHSINYDLDVRAKFGFRPEDYRITGALDTCEISKDVLNHDFKFTLKNVLKELGFTRRHFHNGGNDANFTVRALLLFLER
jgi:DNA polymerase III alpha subunit (gram-positive type)